jgi:hypothetical protein
MAIIVADKRRGKKFCLTLLCDTSKEIGFLDALLPARAKTTSELGKCWGNKTLIPNWIQEKNSYGLTLNAPYLL